MAKAKAKSFSALLGARIRTERESYGWTQDELARLCQTGGLSSFTRSVIAAIERGTRDLTLLELSVLLMALAVDLEELLRGAGDVILTGDFTLKADKILDRVLGRFAPGSRMGHGMRMSPVHVDQVPGEADAKAARSLGVSPEKVAEAATKLWGRTLTAERDALVKTWWPDTSEDPRRLQALRGHATRTLLEELEPMLKAPRRRKKPEEGTAPEEHRILEAHVAKPRKKGS